MPVAAAAGVGAAGAGKGHGDDDDEYDGPGGMGGAPFGWSPAEEISEGLFVYAHGFGTSPYYVAMNSAVYARDLRQRPFWRSRGPPRPRPRPCPC